MVFVLQGSIFRVQDHFDIYRTLNPNLKLLFQIP